MHAELKPFYSRMGRPSVDPVLMIRMLIIGYVFAIRSEWALCREVQVNLAYRLVLRLEHRGQDPRPFGVGRNPIAELKRQSKPRSSATSATKSARLRQNGETEHVRSAPVVQTSAPAQPLLRHCPILVP